jgi:PAS domain S-box-containing protein
MTENPNFQKPKLSLKELEKRYQNLFNSISDLIMIHDLEGHLLNVNPAVTKLSGYTFEELIGQPISDFIIPKFRSLFRDEYLNEIKKQGRSEGVVAFHAKDGSEHFIEYRNVLVKQAGCEPYVNGLGRDITERIRSERNLRESEERYRTVFETTGNATIIIEKDETISLSNSTFEELSGYSKEEIEGKKKWTEFVIKEDLKKLKTYHRDRCSKALSHSPNCEFRFIDRKGKTKNILLTIGPIADTQRSVASLLNITDRKQVEVELQKAHDQLEHRVKERTSDLVKANEKLKQETEERRRVEEALQISQERYKLATNAAKVGVWDWNVVSNDFYLDPNVKEILGYSDSEIPNELDVWSEYVHPEDRETVMETFQAHIDGKTPEFICEHRMNHKDGTVRWIMARGIAICDARGNPTRVVGTDTDISERKQAEEEKKKLEVKFQLIKRLEAIGTLAGGIAHEFNNLLMGIQGNASFLLYGMDYSHPHFDALKNIEKCVRKGAKLTKQLLGYARKGKYQMKSINLNQLVEDTADSIGKPRREVIFHHELSNNLFAIEAEPRQIEQMLLSLYANAACSMPSGGEIMIQTLNATHEDMTGKLYKPKPGNYVRLTVTDTSLGMDKGTQERIFEPFFTTNVMGRGTGLGLASVYGIVKSHGGYIEVDSEVGRGTTFTIFLPASKIEIHSTVKSDDRLNEGTGTILLVDDEEIVLEAGTKMLERLGYSVLEARSGMTAINIYKDKMKAIDMIILDMIMPKMDGGKTYEKLKDINPNVKVLLASGYSIEGQATEILKRGCEGFIQKPFNLRSLSGKVKKILSTTTRTS